MNHLPGASAAVGDLAPAAPATGSALLPPGAPAGGGHLPLKLLAGFAAVLMLQWASAVLVPLMVGLTISYALSPAVDRLQQLSLPRALAAGLLLSALGGVVGWTAWSLSDDATRFVESLPAAAQKVRQTLRTQRSGAMDQMQQAATQLEQAAQEGSAGKPAPVRGVTRVQVEPTQFSVKDYVWNSLPGMLAAAGQATVILFVAFFLLASGDSFRRKIVRLAGPTLARRKLTVQAMDEIGAQVRRYLLVQVVVSVAVGVATGGVFWAIGVDNAVIWGVLAFALNLVPYLGALVLTVGAAFVAFVQFGSFDMAALVAAASLAIHTVSGYLLTPWLTSLASRLNAVTVFVGVLAFGWLWGLWGLVLGVPILLILKAVCDRVPEFHPVAELLGR